MTIRSFVAIDLPELVKERLNEVGEQLRELVPHRSVRWSRVSGIHLTLKFLGDVDQADLSKINAGLAEASQRHTPFALAVGGVGCFPNSKRPRVVWVGVQEETGALKSLQHDVERSLVPLGFEAERRVFRPHLTLGRTQRRASPADQRGLGEIVTGFKVGELARIQVEGFRLMRSDLRPDGAIYTPLTTFDLAGDG